MMRIYPHMDEGANKNYPTVDIDQRGAFVIRICMSSFSRKVRDIRKRAGLTQAEFASALKVGQSTVSRWESLKYEQSPDMDALIKICNFANVNLAFLMGDDDTIHRKSDQGMAVKVIGEALTGVWSESARWEDEAAFEVQLPAARNWQDYSMEGIVIGDDSMNEVYSRHTIVVAMLTGEVDQPPVEDGDRVVVVRIHEKGLLETTVREYRGTPDGKKWLWPKSDHPMFQEPFSLDGAPGIVATNIVGIVACAFVFERVAQLLLD